MCNVVCAEMLLAKTLQSENKARNYFIIIIRNSVCEEQKS